MFDKEGEGKMFSGSTLTRDTLFYGVAILAERCISFLILPLLTKALSQEMYGVWTQIIVTAGLLMTVILVGFHIGAVRFLAGTGEDKQRKAIFHAMLIIVLLNSFLFVVVAFVFSASLSGVVFGDSRFSSHIRVFGFFLMSEVLLELLTAFLRARKAIGLLSFYYILKNAGRVGILAAGVLAVHIELLDALVSISIFQIALAAVIYFKDILKEARFDTLIGEIKWKEMMFFSLPLVPYSLLIWGNNFIDRYLILHMLDIRQVSIYAVSYSLAGIVGLFYSILGFTLYPHIAQRWNDGERADAARTLRKATEYYLFFAVPFIAVSSVLSMPLIKIFSTSEYLSNWQVFSTLGVGVGIFGLYQINVYGTLLANKTFINLALSAAGLLGNLLLNIILIPHIGILGAAIATLVSNSILAMWAIKICIKHVPYVFPWRTAIRTVVATLLMSGVLLIAKQHIGIDNLWSLLCLFGMSAVVYGAMDLLYRRSLLLDLAKSL